MQTMKKLVSTINNTARFHKKRSRTELYTKKNDFIQSFHIIPYHESFCEPNLGFYKILYGVVVSDLSSDDVKPVSFYSHM